MSMTGYENAAADLGIAPTYFGSAIPEGAVVAAVGSGYNRTNGERWVKATGAGNTGWVCPLRVCTGTPEAAITAPIGTLATRTDGGVGTTLYIKQTGAGNTGWVAQASP